MASSPKGFSISTPASSMPTNPKAKVHDLVKPYQSAKLINFDFNWAGSSTVRQQLVERFTNDILAGRKIS